jgi:hypothetical protein
MKNWKLFSPLCVRVFPIICLLVLPVWTGLLAQDCPRLDLEWARFWGEDKTDLGNAIFVTGDEIYIAGTSKTPGPDSSPLRAVLLKYDTDGNLIWDHTMGYSTEDWGYDVHVLDDDVYLAARISYYATILNYDTSGDLLDQWDWRYSGYLGYNSQERIFARANEVYVAGASEWGWGNPRLRLQRYDQDGGLIWTQVWGPIGHALHTYVSGLAVVEDTIFVAGSVEFVHGQPSESFLQKYDTSGNLLWTRMLIPDLGYLFYQGGMIAHDGGLYFTAQGVDSSRWNVLLFKCDFEGNLLWSTTWGGSQFDIGRDLFIADSSICVVGATQNFGSGGYDAFILKTDLSGNVICYETWGGAGDDVAAEVWVSGGDIYVVGYTQSFGVGEDDVFLLKYREPVAADIDIDPDVLNPRSGGRYITCCIELPVGHDVADIDISTVMLQDVVAAEMWPTGIGDRDGDGIDDLMVKFTRSQVHGVLPTGDSVEVRVTGNVAARYFAGTDTIRVLPPRVVSPNGGEMLEPGSNYLVSWLPPDGHVPEKYSVYCTTDDGTSWDTIVSGLNATSHVWVVPELESDCCRLLVEAHDADGIMGYDLSDQTFTVGSTAGADAQSSTPTLLALHPITPNPTTGSILVRFDLPEAADVRITIHDVTGREIKQLTSGARQAGTHLLECKHTLSGAALSPGIYFIRMEAEAFTQTRSIVVLR